MIFGRKRSSGQGDGAAADSDSATEAAATEAAGTAAEQSAGQEPAPAAATGPDATPPEVGEPAEEVADDAPEESDDEPDDVDEPEPAELVDYRADGPFDIDEVDLSADEVTRIDLGTLILTPWQGLNLQLQVNEATKQVRAVTGVWRKSGIEVALFAAPASGGLAEEQREDIIEEAGRAGGTAELADGPFGPEIRRVLPQTGPKGEQLFHVSRIWFAEGPRWLLRGTLLGEAALDTGNEAKAGPFLEYFRNLIVRRGNKPMVPGELITMELPGRDGS